VFYCPTNTYKAADYVIFKAGLAVFQILIPVSTGTTGIYGITGYTVFSVITGSC
jgi:hypothetical protein